jgi:hypothetical protein
MTKKLMIRDLVIAWVQKSNNQRIKEERYIHHDSVERYLDRNWSKDGIKMMYDKVFDQGCDVNYIITYYTNSKFIF